MEPTIPGKLSIPEWSKDDRPRERMLARGPKAMSDAELVAILIRSGTPSESALDLARTILNLAGNDLHKLAGLGTPALMRINGVGEAKAMSIVAALELGQRRRDTSHVERPHVTSSSVAYELLRADLSDLSHEEFWVVLLDRGCRLLHKQRLSQGGMHGTVADPKLIFNLALEKRASCIVLCHNHPSGQLRPSAEDIALTHKLVEGGRMLDIAIQDHLILAATGYYSFADQGQLF